MWGPRGQGGKKSTSSSSSLLLSRESNNKNTIIPKNLKTQIVTKSHKLKYHFAWFFALIMKQSLDFTEELCIERKVNNNFELEKSKTQKTMN